MIGKECQGFLQRLGFKDPSSDVANRMFAKYQVPTYNNRSIGNPELQFLETDHLSMKSKVNPSYHP